MKVYTEVVIDMATMEVLSETSYEYAGVVAEAKGGGGSSGEVDYPDYMKEAHGQALNRRGNDTLTRSLTYYMNAAFDESPFLEHLPGCMDTLFGTSANPVFGLLSSNIGTDTVAVFNDVYLSVSTNPAHVALLNAEIDIMNDDVDLKVLPRFQAGMRDMQCVMTSAFSIGHAIIESQKNRDVTKLIAETNYNMLKLADEVFKQYLDWQKTLVVHSAELARVYAAGKFDEIKFISEATAKDRTWELELFNYFSTLMASIGGGTPTQSGKEASTAQNALGGAMSGAAVGTSINPGWGTAIGAVVGGVAGALSS
jgi:hypothetical protein